MRPGTALLPVLLLTLKLTSCNELDDLQDNLIKVKKEALGESSYEAVPGKPVAEFLALTLADQNFNAEGTLEAMQVNSAQSDGTSASLKLAEGEGVSDVSEDAIKAYQSAQAYKKTIQTDSYQKLDSSYLAIPSLSLTGKKLQLTEGDTINWTLTEDQFTIPNLEKASIKDQGERATCSAFAGVSQIEAFLMLKYGISSIDLSEQRFYYFSKPDSWSDGGDLASSGSNAGTGFAKSAGFEHENITYPPDTATDFNIPLELDCPYQLLPGTNDLQLPQLDSCKKGVAKVTDFAAWLYQWEKRLETPQQIMDALINWRIPIIVSTKLSSNWEINDGMITLAESGGAGATTHAAGHAYLIVGVKKIDESKYPGEGGMCFIIKNSWGNGWGVNGFSCMTLAWFNTWRYDSAFPQVLDVNLDTTKFADAKNSADAIPTATYTPDGNGSATPQKKKTNRVGKVLFLASTDTSILKWSYLDKFYTFVRQNASGEDGSKLTVKGLLSDRKTLTKELSLVLKQDGIFYQEEGFPEYQVGKLTDNGIMLLCTQEFTEVCHLNYDAPSNSLIIGLTEEQASKEPSTGPYSWKSIGFGGYSIDFSKTPGFNNKVDIQLQIAGKATNPLRFRINPTNGDISYHRRVVGNTNDFSLCNKDYKKVCRLVISGSDFYVFFKAQ